MWFVGLDCFRFIFSTYNYFRTLFQYAILTSRVIEAVGISVAAKQLHSMCNVTMPFNSLFVPPTESVTLDKLFKNSNPQFQFPFL